MNMISVRKFTKQPPKSIWTVQSQEVRMSIAHPTFEILGSLDSDVTAAGNAPETFNQALVYAGI